MVVDLVLIASRSCIACYLVAITRRKLPVKCIFLILSQLLVQEKRNNSYEMLGSFVWVAPILDGSLYHTFIGI